MKTVYCKHRTYEKKEKEKNEVQIDCFSDRIQAGKRQAYYLPVVYNAFLFCKVHLYICLSIPLQFLVGLQHIYICVYIHMYV